MEKDTDQNMINSSKSLSTGTRPVDMITVPGKKAVVVGIVFRPREIILVKTEKKQTANHQLLDYNTYPIPEGVEINSPAYSQILNTAINSFCSLDKRYETWYVMPSIDVQTKYLAVPKVKTRQLYNAVYWSFKNEIPFDEDQNQFDFDIIGTIIEEGVEKIEILAYSVPKDRLDKIKQVFSNAGIALDGVSIVAFGIQNLLRTQFLVPGCETVCTLFVGTDWSRIDIFTDNHLYLSRDIKTGYQSFLHNIEEIIPQKNLKQSAIAKIAEDFFKNHLIYSKITSCEENKHFSMIESVTDRLVKQIARTFEYFVSNSGRPPIQKLYLTGRLCDFEGLIDYLSKKLGIQVEVINSFSGSKFQNDPKLQVKSISDLYLPAFGMSLSDTGHTPNFVNTFKQRQTEKKHKTIDRLLVASLLFIFILISGTMYLQKNQIQTKKNIAEKIVTQIEQMGAPITEQMILDKNRTLINYQKRVQITANHYSSIAAISEVCKLTSDRIQLLDMVILNAQENETIHRSLTAKGYIFGNKLLLDSALAGYRETLNSSVLFNNIKILQKSFLDVNDKDVIFFEIKMDINRKVEA